MCCRQHELSLSVVPSQHVLKAPMDGIVDRIGVQPGQIVQQNSLVVKLTDAAAAAQA